MSGWMNGQPARTDALSPAEVARQNQLLFDAEARRREIRIAESAALDAESKPPGTRRGPPFGAVSPGAINTVVGGSVVVVVLLV